MWLASQCMWVEILHQALPTHTNNIAAAGWYRKGVQLPIMWVLLDIPHPVRSSLCGYRSSPVKLKLTWLLSWDSAAHQTSMAPKIWPSVTEQRWSRKLRNWERFQDAQMDLAVNWSSWGLGGFLRTKNLVSHAPQPISPSVSSRNHRMTISLMLKIYNQIIEWCHQYVESVMQEGREATYPTDTSYPLGC